MVGITACGTLLLALGAAVLAYSWSYGFGQLSQPGPGLFGVFASAGLSLLAAAYLAQAWLSWKRAGAPPTPPAGTSDRNALLVVFVLWVYVLAMPWLGFGIATCIVMAILFRMAGTASWNRSIAFGIATGLMATILFDVVMNLKLPRGLLP